jgi:hypothetical protein
MKHRSLDFARTETALERICVWVDRGNESYVHYKVVASYFTAIRNNSWNTTDSD